MNSYLVYFFVFLTVANSVFSAPVLKAQHQIHVRAAPRAAVSTQEIRGHGLTRRYYGPSLKTVEIDQTKIKREPKEEKKVIFG